MLGNCCDDTCTYVREKFNRANETPVASPCEKLLGNTWNLRDELLDGINTGTYRYNFAFPGAATDARHASVRFRINSAGTTELLLAVAEDSFFGQPYDWFTAFVEYKASGCSFLGANSFYHGLGYGALPGPSITNRVQCPSLTLNEWHRLEGCLIPNAGSYGYDGYNLIIAKLTCADGTIYSCQELSSTGQTLGANGGLKFNRSGSIGSVEFDDYEETYYRDSPSGQHRTCPWCHTGCAISQDNFTTDEPCLWDVRSGSYTVSGGLMMLTATSVIQHHIFHPDLRTTHKVTVDVQDNGVESKVYIGNGYAKLTYSAGLRTLTLYDNSSNVLDTDVQTVAVTSDSSLYMSLTLCYSRGVLSCTVTGRGSDLCVDDAIAETASAYWASLGGSSGAVFDNFVFSKTYNADAPSDAACDHCDSCPTDCTACIAGTIEKEIVATIYDIAAGDGGDGPPPHYQCPWPMTGEDGSDINGTSWACTHGMDNAFSACCQWTPAGPTDGDGTIYRSWQSDFLIWNDCLHPCDGDPTNGSDPCGSDECTGCGGFIPTSTDLGYKRVLRLVCVNVCVNGDVWALVAVNSHVYNVPTTVTQDQQLVTFKASLAGSSTPYDCNGNLPLRLDFWGLDGSSAYCGTDATDGGGTNNGYYDWSNAYIIIENL